MTYGYSILKDTDIKLQNLIHDAKQEQSQNSANKHIKAHVFCCHTNLELMGSIIQVKAHEVNFLVRHGHNDL